MLRKTLSLYQKIVPVKRDRVVHTKGECAAMVIHVDRYHEGRIIHTQVWCAGQAI